jgi:hypothetical protein
MAAQIPLDLALLNPDALGLLVIRVWLLNGCVVPLG